MKIKVCCFKSNLLKIFTMANPDQLDPDMNFLNDVKPILEYFLIPKCPKAINILYMFSSFQYQEELIPLESEADFPNFVLYLYSPAFKANYVRK